MNQQATQVELTAEKRAVLGKQVKKLRDEGIVPGVIYGRDSASVSLQFDGRDLRKLVGQVGASQLISIAIKDQAQPEMALLRDVQRDVLTGDLLHVDFYRVNMSERLRTEIPLVAIGESPVIEAREGILIQGITTIEVECLPGDLVDAIEVDLSELVEINHAILVEDLAVPGSIDVLTSPDEMIVRIVHLEEEILELEEEEEEEALFGEMPEVEVIGEGEEEEEAEEFEEDMEE